MLTPIRTVGGKTEPGALALPCPVDGNLSENGVGSGASGHEKGGDEALHFCNPSLCLLWKLDRECRGRTGRI